MGFAVVIQERAISPTTIVRSRCSIAGFILTLAAGMPMSAFAADVSQAEILERLERLERQQQETQELLRARDARILELESQLAGQKAEVGAASAGAAGQAALDRQPVSPVGRDESKAETANAAATTDAAAKPERKYFGEYQPYGAGFKLVDTPMGDVNFSAWTYVRYLNQKSLDDTYTDAFGRTNKLNLLNNTQLNKVNLTFKGWLYDPAFQYLLFAWTSNPSMGDGAQVVLAGNLSYTFNKNFTLAGGIMPLPATRSLMGNHPLWLKTDNRVIADEFFRGSYTTGFAAAGEIAEGLNYKVMVGNNLSQLGVSSAQLDGVFNTLSGAITWMPTTGEFGPLGGYGDFEFHEKLATQIGVHLTRSRENAQNQPTTDDPENSQIRLSDGTLVFGRNAFNTGANVQRATYLMSSVDGGIKYRGYSLEGAYYARWVDDFVTTGFIPVNSLFDQGIELQASMMVIPQTLQPYVSASKIFGEYGDPWDAALGLNWFPFKQRLLRVNTELLYLSDSPVGYTSVPFIVGGNGVVFYTNAEMKF